MRTSNSTSMLVSLHSRNPPNPPILPPDIDTYVQYTDLSSLFNWNTKQVFAYITASYPSESDSEPPSEVIIWDAILASATEPWHQNQYVHPRIKASNGRVTRPSKPGILRLSNQKPKYQITDYTGKLEERANATLELGWNVQPWVGALTWTNWEDRGFWTGLSGGRSEAFDFPSIRAKKEESLPTEKGGEKNRGKPA